MLKTALHNISMIPNKGRNPSGSQSAMVLTRLALSNLGAPYGPRQRPGATAGRGSGQGGTRAKVSCASNAGHGVNPQWYKVHASSSVCLNVLAGLTASQRSHHGP